MVEIGARIAAARRTATLRIQRDIFLGEFRIAQVQRPVAGEGLPVAPRPGGQDAAEHIAPAYSRPDDIVRLAHAHQVARTVPRQMRGGRFESFEHCCLAFADGQPAYGVAIEADRAEALGRPGTQMWVDATL